MQTRVRPALAVSGCVVAMACGCMSENAEPRAVALSNDRPLESAQVAAGTGAGMSAADLAEAGRRARVEVDYLRRVFRDDGRDPNTGAGSLQRGLPCRVRESEDRVPGGDLLVVDDSTWFNAVIDAGLCVYGCAVCGSEAEGSALTLGARCPRARESLEAAERELAKAGF